MSIEQMAIEDARAYIGECALTFSNEEITGYMDVLYFGGWDAWLRRTFEMVVA